jgi:hypothetical protein
MEDILEALREAFVRAENAWAADDEDAWYLAMHQLRFAAWLGKELIHTKRLAEHERTRVPATKSRRKLDVSTLEDLLNDTPATIHTLDRPSGLG